jgi:hypothetical protein
MRCRGDQPVAEESAPTSPHPRPRTMPIRRALWLGGVRSSAAQVRHSVRASIVNRAKT